MTDGQAHRLRTSNEEPLVMKKTPDHELTLGNEDWLEICCNLASCRERQFAISWKSSLIGTIIDSQYQLQGLLQRCTHYDLHLVTEFPDAESLIEARAYTLSNELDAKLKLYRTRQLKRQQNKASHLHSYRDGSIVWVMNRTGTDMEASNMPDTKILGSTRNIGSEALHRINTHQLLAARIEIQDIKKQIDMATFISLCERCEMSTRIPRTEPALRSSLTTTSDNRNSNGAIDNVNDNKTESRPKNYDYRDETGAEWTGSQDKQPDWSVANASTENQRQSVQRKRRLRQKSTRAARRAAASATSQTACEVGASLSVDGSITVDQENEESNCMGGDA